MQQTHRVLSIMPIVLDIELVKAGVVLMHGCGLNKRVWSEYVGVFILFPPNPMSPDKTLQTKNGWQHLVGGGHKWTQTCLGVVRMPLV